MHWRGTDEFRGDNAQRPPITHVVLSYLPHESAPKLIWTHLSFTCSIQTFFFRHSHYPWPHPTTTLLIDLTRPTAAKLVVCSPPPAWEEASKGRNRIESISLDVIIIIVAFSLPPLFIFILVSGQGGRGLRHDFPPSPQSL